MKKLFEFLRDHITCLQDITVPSLGFIHSQRHMIPTLCMKQTEAFVNNAKSIVISVDGTCFKNKNFQAVVLFDESNNSQLLDLTKYTASNADGLTESVLKILGKHKDAVFSKTVSILSDTDHTAKKSCRSIIEKINVQENRVVSGSVSWLGCMMHVIATSETNGFKTMSTSTQHILQILSKIGAPTGNRYSKNNISHFLELSCREQQINPIIQMVPAKGCRSYYLT